ncbi:MAG: hypothetical protein ABJB11_22250 [Ferruginibacter sp.]
MKKFITAILAILYLGTSSGATIHLHYCMGKLANWDLNPIESKTCPKCLMEKSSKDSDGCCKDEQKFVKNNNDHKSTETIYQFGQLSIIALPVSFIEIPSVQYDSLTESHPVSHAPPGANSVAVYIRNCVFRI